MNNNKTMEISLLKQIFLAEEDLNQIINLKLQYWHYSFESQKEWIIKNIEPGDFNLLLKIQNNLVGFMNLVKVNAELDKHSDINLLGVGNVCVSKELSGKGLGLLLMQIANYHIQTMGYNGILLCSDKLVPFYLKSGWIKSTSKVYIVGTRFDGNTMFINDITTQQIALNRNF